MSIILTQEAVVEGVDVEWISTCAYLVFLGRFGLMFREMGMVRGKNTQAVMFRHLMDMCVQTSIWWFTGYAFAFGSETGWFLGKTNFATSKFENDFYNLDYANWVYQWALAMLASGIILGPVSERCTLWSMMLHNALFIGWAYPIVVHWCRFGWLYENGYTDQAGGGIVLMSAGFAGMFATIMLGSRIDRYSPSHQADFRPSNVPFMVIGSVLIWVALFGFSTGSTYSIVGFDSTRVPLAALNTILASGMGGFTASMMHYVMNRRFSNRYSLEYMIGGMLTAMVAVSTGCTLISAWAAWLYGVMSGLIFTSMSKLYIRLKIDDPVDAITIFGFGGMFGLFATAFFDTEDGVFYWGKHELGMNVLGIVSIFGWIGLHSLVLLGVLRIFNLLREDAGVELMGQDQAFFGGRTDLLKIIGRVEGETLNREAAKRNLGPEQEMVVPQQQGIIY